MSALKRSLLSLLFNKYYYSENETIAIRQIHERRNKYSRHVLNISKTC